MSTLFYCALIFFLLLCFLLSSLILLQESKGMGLGSQLLGGGEGSLLGTSTALVIKKLTATLIALFLLSCLLFSLWTASLGRKNPSPPPPLIEERAPL